MYKNEELLKKINKSSKNHENVTTYKLAFDYSVDKKLDKIRPDINFKTSRKSEVQE